jgi:hypothetical protein
MIKISLSFSGKEGVGKRIDRLQDQEETVKEKTEDFIHRAKKKKKKGKRNSAIPYAQDNDQYRMKVSKENWLGRMERSHPKRRRTTLPLVKVV